MCQDVTVRGFWSTMCGDSLKDHADQTIQMCKLIYSFSFTIMMNLHVRFSHVETQLCKIKLCNHFCCLKF